MPPAAVIVADYPWMVPSTDLDDSWVERFHRGDRSVLEACYREHYATVDRAAGAILSGADRETAVHDVFLRIMDSADARRSFQGGSFAAWIATVARNHALNVRQRGRWEKPAGDDLPEPPPPHGPPDAELRAEAKLLVERFCREEIPAEWRPLFEARFMRQLSQRDAAAELGMHRTTLVYRELQIRRRLRRFVFGRSR